jgi:hypothetical protein
VKTPYVHDWIAGDNNSDTESDDEPLLCDGSNAMIDEDSSRRRSA